MRTRPLPLIISLLCLTVLLLAGCAATSTEDDHTLAVITEELVWSGDVEMTESIKLPRGTRLVIEPGTTVRFATVDEDDDGLGDLSLTLEGELVAKGTPGAPIRFTSADQPVTPGSWGEVRIDFGKVELRHALIEGSTRGLHLHFTSGTVADSIFRDNVDGTRIGESRMTLTRCLFTGNTGKGYNARASTNRVTSNWFRGNRRGVFLFEGDEGSTFTGNRFSNNEVPFRLGDFYEGTVKVQGNRWDDPPEGAIDEGNQTARLLTDPVDEVGPVGPEGWPLLHPVWEVELGGFVDADPLADELGIYAASWSGRLVRLGFMDGSLLAESTLDDVVDSGFALARIDGKPWLVTQAWDRAISIIDGETMAVYDRYIERPSSADDHKQSIGVVAKGADGTDRLFIGTWAGNLHRFRISPHRLGRSVPFALGGPVRAPLAATRNAAGALIVFVPCEDGNLYAIAPDSDDDWSFDTGHPVLSGVALAGGRVFVADKGGTLTALPRDGGRAHWSATLCGPSWYAQPVVDENLLILGDDGGCLSAFDPADGTLRWRTRLDGGVRARPASLPDGVAIPTLGGSFYLVDRADGLVRDRLGHPQPLLSSPARLGNRLFFGGRDEKLHAVDVNARALTLR